MHTSQQTTSEGGGHTSHLPFCSLPPNLGPHLPGRSSSPSLSFGISESGPRSLKYSLSHICGHPGNSVFYVALDKINIGLKDKSYESPAWDTSNWLDSLQIPRATRCPQSCGYVPRLATSWDCTKLSQDSVHTIPFNNLLCWSLASLIPRFTEFEIAEEMENSRLEMLRGVQYQVLTTTPQQDHPRPPVPEVVEEPGRAHIVLGLVCRGKVSQNKPLSLM